MKKEFTSASFSPAKRAFITTLLCTVVSLLSFKSNATPGGALDFDGQNCYVDIGFVLTGGHSYTKEAWIKANQGTTHNIITGDDDPFWLSGNHLRAAHGWQTIPNDIQDPDEFPMGQWVHVAVTFDSATSTMKLYKNGVEVASSNTMSTYGTTYLQVGAYNSSNLFDGDIDEVRVWNRALCIDELQTTMNGELTGNEAGLIVYYKFNDGLLGLLNLGITTAADASGHNNNGTLHNFSLTGLIGNFVQGIVTGNSAVWVSPAATASAAGPASVPQGSAVTLNANSAAGYQWQKNNADIDGATASTYTATTSGSYAVRITTDHGCSNTSTPVTVTINAVATPLTPPADVTACDNGTNSKTISISTAGLTSPSVSYSIAGATSGTGTGASLTKNFNIGVSTITWTVTDAVNGTRTCKTTVTILESPTVTISTSKPDAFCNELAVMAKSNHSTTTSYAWTYNNASYASTQTIDLDNTKGDGYYYVKATDANGCSSASASYNYQKQNMANSYTLLAYKSIDLASNNDVLSGALGVMNWGGYINMDWAGSVPSTGFTKACTHNISWWCTVNHKYYSQVSGIALPTMLYNTANTTNLSSYTKTSSGTVSNNYKTLTINSYLNVTVKGNAYHRIKIKNNATVTFTAADISLDSLDVDDNATLIFNQNTILRVSKSVILDDGITLNTTSQKVSFYMSDAISDVAKFYVGNNCNITANVFMPKGNLVVNDASNNDCWKTTHNCHAHNHNNCQNDNTGTFMIGYYIAERITGGTNVTWDNYTCVDIPVAKGAANNGTVFTTNVIDDVTVFPNPNNGNFRIAMPKMDSDAQINIYDITGKVILTKEVPKTDAQMIEVSLANVSKGMYLVEVKGGELNYKTKMIVQ
jgi:hypothetical protein